jgi:hypothetical protein
LAIIRWRTEKPTLVCFGSIVKVQRTGNEREDQEHERGDGLVCLSVGEMLEERPHHYANDQPGADSGHARDQQQNRGDDLDDPGQVHEPQGEAEVREVADHHRLCRQLGGTGTEERQRQENGQHPRGDCAHVRAFLGEGI